jgi:hypothetical protein
MLKKARDRMVEERDAHAKVLAAPFDRDKAERARMKFVELQGLIDSIDRAIHGEQASRANCFAVAQSSCCPLFGRASGVTTCRPLPPVVWSRQQLLDS